MKHLIFWFTLWLMVLGLIIESTVRADTLASYETGQDAVLEIGCGGAGCATRTRRGAQSFQLTDLSTISGVEVYIQRSTDTNGVTARIETDSTNAPSGSLAHANATCTIAHADIPVSYDFEPCSMSSFNLSASTKYWLVLRATTETTDQQYLWGRDSSSPSYANGNSQQYDNSVWTDQSGSDALFKILGTAINYPVTGPTCFASETKLVAHMSGPDAGTNTGDSAFGYKTLTMVGDAQIDTAQSVFGGSSLLLDGTGDYVSVPDSSDWDLGSGDFNIEARVRFSNISGAREIIGQFDTNNNRGWTLDWNNTNELRFLYSTDGTSGTQTIETFSWTPSTDTWYHVSISRSGSSLRAFIDGTQIGSTKTLSSTIFNSTAVLTIGAILSTGSPINLMNGWLDEVRIVKGTAVWTSNFTSPTVEQTPCSSTMVLEG